MKPASTVTQQVQTVFGVSIFLLILSSAASYYSNRQMIDAIGLVNHTAEVITKTLGLSTVIREAESGQRGYILTSDAAFLTPYRGAHERALAVVENLKTLTVDNPAQQSNLIDLKVLVDERFAQMERTLGMVDGLDETRRAAAFVNNTGTFAPGRRTMQDLATQLEVIKSAEEDLMARRSKRLERLTTWTPVLLIVAALLSILISVLAFFRIRSDVEARARKSREDAERMARTAQRVTAIEGVTAQLASGDFSARSMDEKGDDLGRISGALNAMGEALGKNFSELAAKSWLAEGAARIAGATRSERGLHAVSDRLVGAVAGHVGAQVGTLYVAEASGALRLSGAYATTGAPEAFEPGEGLVGQAVQSGETLVSRDLPAGYLTVRSSIGEAAPVHSVIVPLMQGERTVGAMELGLLREPQPHELEFLRVNRDTIAISVNAAVAYERTQALLEETQAQAEELQAQHSEMESINAELEAQAQKLQASEEELRVQQEELQQTNAELEERSRTLEERNLIITERNEEVQRQAEALAQSAKYNRSSWPT